MNNNDYNANPFASTHSLDANPFDDPDPYNQGAASSGGQRPDPRLQDLQQREADLERRESALAAKAENIRVHGRNNWPPYFPLIFHSIPDEIPANSQVTVTRLYWLWLVLVGTLVLNMVACICIVASGGGISELSSIGYLFIIPPLSFLMWYRPIYNGFMKEQSLYYYLYFIFCGFHLLFSLYMIIGIPSTGSGGIINMISQFSGQHWTAGAFSVLATVGWLVEGLGLGFYYRQIWEHNKKAGHSIEQAKTELATHGAKAYFTRG